LLEGCTVTAREPLYRQLKPGPGLSAVEVVTNQRARLFGAMVEMVSDGGYGSVKVREISRLAGVSTRTFYDRFGNVEECFACTYSWIMGEALAQASEAASPGPEALRSRFHSLLATFAEHPRAAYLVLVEAFGAGAVVTKKQRAAIRGLETLVREDFKAEPDPVVPPPRLVRAIAAAILRVARVHMMEGRGGSTGEAAEELAAWALALRDNAAARLARSRRTRSARAAAPLPQPIGNDRQRLLIAVTRLADAHGYGELTVPLIRREAGVSRRTFDTHFAGVADCFLRAVEDRTTEVAERAEHEVAASPGWEQGVMGMCELLCAETVRDPTLARLAFVDVFAPGRLGLECRERIVARWADRLRQSAPAGTRPSELAAEASIAAVWRIIQAEVAAGRPERLEEAAPIMAFAILAPTIGAVAAERVIGTKLEPGG
jgi:AcrR family transcriptional regulator